MSTEIDRILKPDHGPLAEMPDPTEDQLRSPEFEAVWNVIKSWDVNVPEHYEGYCGATGSHVVLILNALPSPDQKGKQ